MQVKEKGKAQALCRRSRLMRDGLVGAVSVEQRYIVLVTIR